jgi:hypothetical protein
MIVVVSENTSAGFLYCRLKMSRALIWLFFHLKTRGQSAGKLKTTIHKLPVE